MPESNRTEVLYDEASSLMNKESWNEAISLLNRELTLVKADWRLSWNLGWCHFKLGRLDQAQRHLFRTARLAPDNPTCRWALGIVLLEKKQFKKAESILKESLRMKESHKTRIALALAFLSQGKVEDAENTHVEGIRLTPNNSDAYESYAAFLADVGRQLEALEINRKASELEATK